MIRGEVKKKRRTARRAALFFCPRRQKQKKFQKNIRNRPVPFSFVLAFPVKLRADFHREPTERNGKKWMKNC